MTLRALAAKELRGIAEESRCTTFGRDGGSSGRAVLLAGGDAPAALTALRRAYRRGEACEAPYEVARVHVLLGLACRALGDEDSAEMELDAARGASQLGAGPDLALIEELAATGAIAGGLTGREVEVVAQVATGETNRDIAADRHQ